MATKDGGAAGEVAPPKPRVSLIQPIPLTSKQESEIRDIYQASVRAKCAEQIKDFAACAQTHSITVNFKCSTQKLNMNHCLRQHGTQAEQDRARQEWFAKIDERKKQREKEALERIENEKKLKDWWGMDENWQRLDRKADEERLVKREAVGKKGG